MIRRYMYVYIYYIYLVLKAVFFKLKIERTIVEQQMKAKNRTYNFTSTTELVRHPYVRINV